MGKFFFFIALLCKHSTAFTPIWMNDGTKTDNKTAAFTLTTLCLNVENILKTNELLVDGGRFTFTVCFVGLHASVIVYGVFSYGYISGADTALQHITCSESEVLGDTDLSAAPGTWLLASTLCCLFLYILSLCRHLSKLHPRNFYSSCTTAVIGTWSARSAWFAFWFDYLTIYIFLNEHTRCSLNTWPTEVITWHPLAVVFLLRHQHSFREELTQAEPEVIILFNGQ